MVNIVSFLVVWVFVGVGVFFIIVIILILSFVVILCCYSCKKKSVPSSMTVLYLTETGETINDAKSIINNNFNNF